MWANAAVSGFAPITIHAEYLKTGRKVIGNQPTVNFLTATAIHSSNLTAMLCAVIVDVVQR